MGILLIVMNTDPFRYKISTALVTGASRGIGEAFVRELANRGIVGLVLTARTAEDLTALAEEIRCQYPAIRVEIVVADLASPDAPEKLKAETDRLGLTVDLLVNNAGFGSYGLFDESDMARSTAMVEVNIAALMKLTRLHLPEMRKRGQGGILNIASTAGFQPVPYMGLYAATKAFVLSFSEALWAESQEWGGNHDVRIVCVCPGDTKTNFGDGMTRGRWENGPQSTPKDVAVCGLDALDRNASYQVVGTANYVVTLGSRWVPRAMLVHRTAALFRPVTPDAKDESVDSGKSRIRTIGGIALAVGLLGAVLAAILRQKKSRG